MNGWCDLVHVVADDTEPDVLRVLFDDATESGLGSLGHHVGFVQDYEFVAFGEQSTCFCELLDLLAYDINSTIVRCIELSKILVKGHE